MAEVVTADRRERQWRLWSAIAGIAFAVLLVVGMGLTGGTPNYDAPAAEWEEWFADSGNRQAQVIGAALLVLSALSLVVFTAGLGRRLRAAGADRDGWSTVALVAGAIVSATLVVAAAAVATVSAAIELAPDDFPIPGADVAMVLEQFGFGVVLLGGGTTAAVLVAATSLAARGTLALPGWLVTAGFVVAVLLLASVAFLPFLLLPLWAIVVSVVTLRAGSAGRRSGVAPAA